MSTNTNGTARGRQSSTIALPVQTIRPERYDEIAELLNGFRTFGYEHGTDVVNAYALAAIKTVGFDANLEEALRWIDGQPDVRFTVYDRDAGTAEVGLTDGTVIAWISSERSWSVTVTEPAVLATSPRLVKDQGNNRMRVYDGDRLIATAVRSNGNGCDWIGWRLITVLDSTGAAHEALMLLAENARVARAVTL